MRLTLPPACTVDDLIRVLTDASDAGHGSTPVMRCDYEAGPCSISEVFTQHDPGAHERGETPAPVIILLG